MPSEQNSPTWSRWQTFDGDPYLHWRERTQEAGASAEDKTINFGDLDLAFSSALLQLLDKGPLRDEEIDRRVTQETALESYAQALQELRAPIPETALNSSPPSNLKMMPETSAEVEASGTLPKITDPDTVIMGVIDVGIPLGHNRFRDKHGATRILAAWQQLAGPPSAHLPFGKEIFASKIDELLKTHSGDKLDGWLDEDSFNRETGVVDFHHDYGEREAARHASHGAHVLDLAAGCDPETKDKREKEFAEKVKIIAVNAPSAQNFGASGEFLDGYILAGVDRILAIADHIWENSFDNEMRNGANKIGYPIVINISFGKQAGSKSSLDLFAGLIGDIRRQREAQDLSDLNIVMPAGNDNLSRCNAFLEPKKGGTVSLDWRIQPGDQSANFVEVWTAPPRSDKEALKDPSKRIALCLIAPDGVISPIDEELERAMTAAHFGRKASIYKQVYRFPANEEDPESEVASSSATEAAATSSQPESAAEARTDEEVETVWLTRHVLCIAPTDRPDLDQETGDAGVWTIQIKNRSGSRIQCALSVQTDQGLTRAKSVNRRSYFDDHRYRVYDDQGRVVETYHFPDQPQGEARSADMIGAGDGQEPSPVRRHGTMNASSAHDQVARIGGYRVSDKRPAAYSASGRGRSRVNRQPSEDDFTEVDVLRAHDVSGAPTASLPSEDAPMLPGVLGAGGPNGTVVAMRGTSFASPQAARWIAYYLLDLHNHDVTLSDKQILFQLARILDPHRQIRLTETLGGGRIPSPTERKAPRL